MSRERPNYSRGQRLGDDAHGAGGRATMRAMVFGVPVPVLCSQADVAVELGVSQAAAGQIEKRALAKIRKGLGL